MIDVLLVARAAPEQLSAEMLARLAASGARVHLAGRFAKDECPAVPESWCRIPAARRGLRIGANVYAGRRFWNEARRSAWLRRRARKADVLVALDENAVYTVWKLAQRNRRADAVHGIVPALASVERRGGRPRGRALRDLRGLVPGAPVMLSAARVPFEPLLSRRFLRSRAGARFWRAALGAPGIPDASRGKITLEVGTLLAEAGRPHGAARLFSGVGRASRSAWWRQELLGAAAACEFADGKSGDGVRHVLPAVRAKLALADEQLAVGSGSEAVWPLMGAMDLAFHRALHFDGLSSPLARAPRKFTASLYRSDVMRNLEQGRGRERPPSVPSGRPHRLLFATTYNENFLGEIRARYDAHPGVETRFCALREDPALGPLVGRYRELLADQLLSDRPVQIAEVERAVRPHLDWADTVFVEWCEATAVLFTLVDPGDTRMIVRLHSYEAFHWWPHFVDFSRVDDVLYVSEHIRDLATAAVPQLRGPDAPRTHVLTNALDLSRYRLPKRAEARFTVALTQVGAVVKDPCWALEVLRLLRAQDTRYRLLFIGAGADREPSEAARRYGRRLAHELGGLERQGAVRRLGQVSDVPAALTEAGIMLNGSVREGSPCGLIEGAASGAVPVVRDWPFFAGGPHGARTLFPADWVVGTPQEAADRILGLTADEETWRAASAAASSHAVATWDWPVVAPGYDRLLLGPREPAGPGERAGRPRWTAPLSGQGGQDGQDGEDGEDGLEAVGAAP